MNNKQIGEASRAMAEAVRQCKPKVISLYPITPQTHIVEALTEMVNDGKLKASVIRSESEHSMVSALAGAYLGGVRAFGATSSQGLALAHEVLHIIAGMRIPAVLGIAARALSAPINIWGDHSDVMSSRDTSWIQLHCKTAQEVYDTIIQAYKIAEKIALPVMVIMDGFTLSHVYEPVLIAEQNRIDEFLPKFRIKHKLDPRNPKTFGPVGFPNTYMEFKHQQRDAMLSAINIIKKTNKQFKEKFGRNYGNGLIEVYNPDAKKVLIASGTTAQTSRNLDCCVVHVRSFRPFPYKEIKKACKDKKDIVVVDRAYSYGSGGPMVTEVRNVVPNARSAVMGLGGRDVCLKSLKLVLKSNQKELWVDNL